MARLPECRCLGCGHLFDEATNFFSGDAPSPGDATLCIKCGRLMFFDQRLRVREPTPDEAAEAASDERVQKLRLAIHLTNLGDRSRQ